MMGLGLFTPERAEALATGRAAALGACAAVFPPMPEDPDGSLVPTLIGERVNRVVREAMGSFEVGERQRRLWWMDGFILGFGEETVASLLRSEPRTQLVATECLRDMANSVHRRVTGEVLDASQSFFAVADAVVLQDDVALAWAVERLWVPQVLDTSAVVNRLRAVCSCAAMTVCAAWRLELISSADAA